MTDLTLRRDLLRPLEWEEMDVNLENLDSDSPWSVAAGHIWYSGKVSLYGDDAVYDLDFTDGVANVATIGTQNADLEVHVDGARKFKIITNTQNRFQVTTDGKVGINIDSDPTYELDVDGNIRARTTLFANQTHSNSFYDGTATLSGGSLTNAVNGEFTGQVRFGSLYDISNDHIIRQLDVDDLSSELDRIPTSYAVAEDIRLLDSYIQSEFDSNNAKMQSTGLHEVTDIGNVTTNDIKVGNITTTGFTDSATATSLTLTPDGDLFGTVTGGWKVPVGTTGERPSNTTGYMRFNTSTSAFEGFNGTAWASLGGVMDVDQDTYILPETTPTADEDTLFFYTGGSERMRINDSGNVGIGNTPVSKLDVEGEVRVNASADHLKLVNSATTARFDIAFEGGSGADALTFTREGVGERMRIDASGNVITGSDTANASDAVTLRQDGTAHVNNAQFSDGNGSVGGTTPSIYSPSSATLAISTNSTERMRIDGSGNVGIGTDNPSSKLDIVHSNNNPLRLQNSTGVIVKCQLEDNATRQGEIALDTGAITFSNGTGSVTERMRIDANGRVGIGTNAPVRQLEVKDNASDVAVVVSSRDFTDGISRFTMLTNVGGANSGGMIKHSGGNLIISNSTNTNTDHVTIDADGKVGIGTDSPSARFHLLDTSSQMAIFGSTSTSTYVQFRSATTTTRGYIGNGSGLVTGASNSDFAFRSEGAAVIATGGQAERMRIDSTGRVGINGTPGTGAGTIGGGTAKLQVAGEGYFSGVTIGGTTVRRDGISGIHFGTGSVRPVGTSGSTEDNAIDLGANSFRFKDGHFSGAVNGGSFVKAGGTSAQFLMADGSVLLQSNIASGSLSPGANINGTLFTGASNITTASWGTARNISIGGTSKSVNGSANYTWTKAEIQANNADQLTTARNINGTAFNGTANITTANWGTARNISIGGTSKSVNGSGNYTWSASEITAGKVSNTFTVQGTAFDGSAAKTVTFTGGTGITVSGTTITNSAPDQTVSLTGAGGLTVTGTYPNFTLTQGSVPLMTPTVRGGAKIGYSTNGQNYAVRTSAEKLYVNVPWTDTTYTAGTGLSLSGRTFTNTAPDQTVTITGAGDTTVTGTYPNFTVSSTSGSTYTAGNGLSLNGTEFKMSGSYTGTFTASGDIVAFSDMALKEDINPISAALDKVSQLTGYTFRRKGEDKVTTGVMAQEVQKVLPEAVHDDDGTLGVAYGNMVGLLIQAVKELSGKVESLETELNKTK